MTDTTRSLLAECRKLRAHARRMPFAAGLCEATIEYIRRELAHRRSLRHGNR